MLKVCLFHTIKLKRYQNHTYQIEILDQQASHSTYQYDRMLPSTDDSTVSGEAGR